MKSTFKTLWELYLLGIMLTCIAAKSVWEGLWVWWDRLLDSKKGS